MQGRKSMRTMLVSQTYNSYLIAYSQERYYTAANLLKALSRLVGVKIGSMPVRMPGIIVNQLPYESFCSANLDSVMIGVDKVLKEYNHGKGVHLWTKSDQERLEAAKSEEEGD